MQRFVKSSLSSFLWDAEVELCDDLVREDDLARRGGDAEHLRRNSHS